MYKQISYKNIEISKKYFLLIFINYLYSTIKNLLAKMNEKILSSDPFLKKEHEKQ